MHDDIDPTSQGLLRCLQVLSAEAAYLSLQRTFSALQEAIATCQDESDRGLAASFASAGTELVH